MSSSLETLRDLIKTGALGINPETKLAFTHSGVPLSSIFLILLNYILYDLPNSHSKMCQF